MRILYTTCTSVSPPNGVLPQAHWYIANIRYVGKQDAAGAVGPLETLLAFDSIPAEVRNAAATLLDEVRAAL